MRAGDINRRVTIRLWQDVANAGFGTTQTFDAGNGAWAFIRPVGAALFYGTQQIQNDVTHQIIVRRTSVLNENTVTALHVVEHKNIRYRVKRAANVEDADVWLQLDVTQLGVFV